MTMVWIGAVQFLIGAVIASWGIGKLDRQDVLYRFQPMTPAAEARAWTITLTGFAIAGISPLTVLMG